MALSPAGGKGGRVRSAGGEARRASRLWEGVGGEIPPSGWLSAAPGSGSSEPPEAELGPASLMVTSHRT